MLREQRPFKFFNLPATYMKEFVREAKGHGLLYVPIRNKQKSDYIELVVFADDAAKIQRIYDNLGLDYHIKISHNDTFDTLYAHCSSICVTVGQEVKQGEVIGYVGTTGNSTGNHLHFEVWKNGERTDALGYFKAKD